MSPRRYAIGLIVVFLFALGLRLGAAAKFVGLSAPPKASASSDQVDYELYAWNLAQGRGFLGPDDEPTAKRAPGTSFLLAPCYAVFGRSWLAGRVWFATLGALTCPLIAWAARPFAGGTAALASAAFLAAYPGHWYFSMHFLSEPGFGLLLALAMGLTVRSIAGGPLWLDLGAGLAWGAAILVRPNLQLAIPLLWLVYLVGRVEPLRRPKRLIVQTLAAAAIVAPWVARNALVMERATITTLSGPALWTAYNERSLKDPEYVGTWVPIGLLAKERPPLPEGEVERCEQMGRYGREYLMAHLGDLPYWAAMRLYRTLTPFEATSNTTVYWGMALGWLGLAPFAALGTVKALRGRDPRAWAPLVPLAAMLATSAIFFGLVRYRDAMAPALAIEAGIGLAWAWSWRRRGTSP